MKWIAIYAIKLYRVIKHHFPRVCRFEPSCSQYAIQALEKYGFWKGTFYSVKRIFRCHPFHPGGYDPLV